MRRTSRDQPVSAAHARVTRSLLLAHRSYSAPAPRLKRRGLLAILFFPLVGAMVVLAGGAVAAGYNFYLSTTSSIRSPGAVIAGLADYGGAQLFDRNGKLLYRFPDPAGGIQTPVRLTQVAQPMVNATVSTEDATFWSSPGLDVVGIMRAAATNAEDNGSPFVGRGGSSITQELVKQTLIPEDQRDARSLTRKLTEAAYSVELTQNYPKSQILEWYLNVTNYGGVYDGVESAAEGYFGVHASQLDLAQAALLAGIPQSPADYSPYSNPDGARTRQGEVLDLMVQHHYITQDEADAAKREDLQFQPPQTALPLNAPWFVEYVRQQLVARFGEHCFETCGLKVTTTLDLDLENKAQEILNDNLTKWGEPVGVHDGALLSMDARTGEILVMLGSRDYSDDSPEVQGKNNFTTAVMQPGSSFKPFVYTTLFWKRGYGPDSIIWDAPFSTPDGYSCVDPVQGGRTQGPIPVRLALGSSLNCPGNRAAVVAGIPNIIDTAHLMGITTMPSAEGYGASIATGGANITMLDMVYGYTTIARNGNMVGDTAIEKYPTGYRPLDPVAFTKVLDGDGNVLYSYEPKTQQVIPSAYPYLVTSIISNCQNRRLIWQCGFPEFVLSDGRQVAAKTGTQQGADTGHTISNWQYMYTPQLVTGGWVGNADRTPWTDVNGGANAVGYSVQQLEDYTTQDYQIPQQDFQQPDDVVSVPVHVPDGSLGELGGCGPLEQGLFAKGTEPDVNNRVCKNGVVTIPPEQLGTGGLGSSPVQQQPALTRPVSRPQPAYQQPTYQQPAYQQPRPAQVPSPYQSDTGSPVTVPQQTGPPQTGAAAGPPGQVRPQPPPAPGGRGGRGR